jgi:hypothetical protein
MARRPERRRSGAGRSAARRRPRTDRATAENRRAYLILAVAGLAVVLIGVMLFFSRTPAINPQTGCRAGALTPDQHTVVLIDQTDPLTPRQIAYVKTLILAEYSRLRQGGELTIRAIDANPESSEREFSRCRVRRGSEVLGVTSNPDLIEADFKRIVGDALNSYLNALRTVPTAPRSPILEAVDSALDAPDFGQNVRDRRLILVSDLAQNSERVSEYRGPGSGLRLDWPAQNELARDMHGIAVRIHYVRRPALGALQTAEQRAFWLDWFRRNGAEAKLGWGLQLVEPPAESRPGQQGGRGG